MGRDVALNFLRGFDVNLVMTTTSRFHQVGHYCLIALCLLLGGRALAESDSMNCDHKTPAAQIQLAEGDQNSAGHLQLSRKVAAGGSIHLDVCSADLRIVSSASDLFRVTVDIDNPDTKLTAKDYVHTFEVTSFGIELRLNLPKHVRAKVVVAVPITGTTLDVNLVRGDLLLDTDRIGGERDVNVVHGHVDILANDDSYSDLEVNVVMGSFHDHRPGGEGHHAMVSQSISGSGKGSIEINVVLGSVDLKPSA